MDLTLWSKPSIKVRHRLASERYIWVKLCADFGSMSKGLHYQGLAWHSSIFMTTSSMARNGALVCFCIVGLRPVSPRLNSTQRAGVWTSLGFFLHLFLLKWYITVDLKVFVIATHGPEGLWRAGWEFWRDNSDTQWKETLHSTGVRAGGKKVSNRGHLGWMRKQTGILTPTRNYIINQQCKFFTWMEMELK